VRAKLEMNEEQSHVEMVQRVQLKCNFIGADEIL